MRAASEEVRLRQRRERRVGAWLLVLLVVVVFALFVGQAGFDPALYAPPPVVAVVPPGERVDVVSPFAPPGFAPASRSEVFEAATLYEKIDGKADLYLSAGFVELVCQRFATPDAAAAFEACVYRMTDADAAFSVFSRQRRPGQAEEGLGPHAVATTNALFVAHGAAYVEVVSADEGDLSRVGRVAFARAWIAAGGTFAPSALPSSFPAEGQVAGSVRLLKDSVFGFARFDNVYTAEYDEGGDLATAFWSERRTADEAQALGEAFVAHLEGAGATRLPPLVPGAATLDALGSLEVVCVRGRHLAGVHQADTEALARRLAAAMCPATAGEEPR
jgi:hypothetical protein